MPRAVEIARGELADVGPRPAAGGESEASIVQQLGDALLTALALLDADAGAVFVSRPAMGPELVADAGLGADELVRLRAGPVRGELATATREAARKGTKTDAASCVVTRRSRNGDLARTAGFATVCTLPVTTPSGERWGLVELYFRRPRRVAALRRDTARAFVRQLGWALERDRRAAEAERRRVGAPPHPPADPVAVARQLGRQQQSMERAVRLQTASAALARSRTVREVCEVAVRQCVGATGALDGWCYLSGAAGLVPMSGATQPAEASPAGALERTAAASAEVAVADELATGTRRAALPLVATEGMLGVLTLTLEPERDVDGDVEYLGALGRVVGQALERARLFEAARAASQAKTDFLAMMSHELRTPLNAIMGYTGLMADEVVGPLNVTQRDQLHRVQAHARHLLTLIEEILTLSRAEAGRDGLRLERAAPAALLREVAEVLAPSAARKGLAFVVQDDGAPTTLRTDPDKVRQVLAHLLTNAIKFTADGGITARVHSAEVDGQRVVRYAVRDSGVGIAPQHLERIFEPFWQADQARTRPFPGTGLGLNVTRRLADLLGGTVAVTSTPGEGSEFALLLPVRD